MIYAIIESDGRASAFYDTNIHEEIPAEAVEITIEQWKELLSDPTFKRMNNGQVITHQKTQEEINTERRYVILGRLAEIDRESIRSIRAKNNGSDNVQDRQKLTELETEAAAIRAELAGL